MIKYMKTNKRICFNYGSIIDMVVNYIVDIVLLFASKYFHDWYGIYMKMKVVQVSQLV